MPKNTLYSDGFADLINAALEGLSNDTAGRMSGLSPETIRRMRKGRVPDRNTLDRLFAGIPSANERSHQILLASGYEQPKCLVERVMIALDGVDNLTEESRRKIIEFVQNVQAQEEQR